jgi:hypothetical protein
LGLTAVSCFHDPGVRRFNLWRQPGSVHGARHDAQAFAASGLADLFADCPTVTGLGYVGADGIDTVPFKRPPGSDLYPSQVEFNTALSKFGPP